MNKHEPKTRHALVSLIFRWLPAVLVMSLLFIVSSKPSTDLPEFGTFDKLVEIGGHMLAYALLAQTFLHALGENDVQSRLIAGILAFIYGISDEFHQSFVPGRVVSFFDLGIDLLGILLALTITSFLPKNSVGRSFPKF